MVKTRNMNNKAKNKTSLAVITRRQTRKLSLKHKAKVFSKLSTILPLRKIRLSSSTKKSRCIKYPLSKMRISFLPYLKSEKKEVLSKPKVEKEQVSSTVIQDSITIHCNLCKKPVEIKKSEQDWKTLCVSCFLKVRGKIVKCSACDIEFLTIGEKKEQNFCYDCTLGIKHGVKSTCIDCKKRFYTSQNTKFQKTHCYDCYLKQTGVESECVTCKTKIYVKPENTSWKKKCYNCYIHNN